jgi:plasmid stabilization system protein ParE
MVKIRVSPEAANDLREIKEYIAVELENPAAAVSTVSKITKAIRGLAKFPDIGAYLSSKVSIPTDYRFLVVGSYLAFYRHGRDEVHVIRVLYGKRDYMKILFGEADTTEN